MNQSCLNIPQIPNPSSYIQPPVMNNTTQYNNNITRNTFLQPPVTLNNNNISRSTITPPGVSSAAINRNNLTPPPNANHYTFQQPSVPIPYNSVLPNTQPNNNLPVNTMMGQSYQPPLPLGSSYIKPPSSPPQTNQSFIQQPSQQQQQGYNQPPSNDYMNHSYIPPPLDHSYLNSQPYETSVADIPSPPTDFTSKPNGDFTLTDHIIKNEYHTVSLLLLLY